MKWLFPVLLLLAYGLNAQKPLPKKFRKPFRGEIPSYYIHAGDTLLEVSKIDIHMSFSKTNIDLRVGSKTYTGTYSCNKKKGIYYITTLMENMHVNEFIEINKKSKILMRKGVSPQPNAYLTLDRK